MATDLAARIAYAQRCKTALYIEVPAPVADEIAQCIDGLIAALGRYDRMASVLRMAYLKHHCDDPAISWQELDDLLFITLTEVMGDTAFQAWLAEQEASRGNG